MDIQGGKGTRGRSSTAQFVTKNIGRYHLTCMQDQNSEQQPLLRPTKRQQSIPVDHLERPENEKLQHIDPPQLSTRPPAAINVRMQDSSLSRASDKRYARGAH
ncbi:MAG: hypothetical protein ACRDYA_02780 [Egibacteraceae bacterium]